MRLFSRRNFEIIMPVYWLDEEDHRFPEPSEFDGDVVAVGGDLSAGRLVNAYNAGIFPWYNEPGDIVWWNPEQRCVLFMENLRISHSMRNVMNKGSFNYTVDKDFIGVIEGCRQGERQGNTWISDNIIMAYTDLHQRGLAHSVEVWLDNELVGGLYGVCMGRMFFGESMFASVPNSSKAGFIWFAQRLKAMGWKLIDCQVHNDHLESLGATTIPRKNFLDIMEIELKYPTLQGVWTDIEAFKDHA